MGKSLFILFALCIQIYAQSFTKEYTYNASENDSKVSARKQALKTVTNMVIDEFGAGIATQFKKDQKVSDEKIEKEISLSVKNFAVSLVKTKIIEEKWNGVSYWVKAKVDMDDVALYEKLKKQFQALIDSSKSKQILTMLSDMSTKEKIQKIISTAITLSFSKQKDNAHYKIIKEFNRDKIYDDKYREFLINTLSKIEYPSRDNRTMPILNYLSTSKPFSQAEQKILLNLLSNVEVGTSGIYLEKILLPNINVCDKKVYDFLVDYVKLANNNKAGLPIYTTVKDEIASFIRIWSRRNINKKCPLLGLDIFDSYLYQNEISDTIDPEVWYALSQSIVSAYPKDIEANYTYYNFLVEGFAGMKKDRRALNLMKMVYKKAFLKEHKTFDRTLKLYLKDIYSNLDKLYEGDITFAIKRGIQVPNKIFRMYEYYNKIEREKSSQKRRALAKAILAFGDKNFSHYTPFLSLLELLYEKKDYYSLDILLPILEKDKEIDTRVNIILVKAMISPNPNLSRKAKKYLMADRYHSTIIETLVSLNNKQKVRYIIFLSNYGKVAADIFDMIKINAGNDNKDIKNAVKWLENDLKKKGYL